MEDEKEVRTHQRQQIWERLRRPGWSHKTMGTVARSFRGIMTGSCRCLMRRHGLPRFEGHEPHPSAQEGLDKRETLSTPIKLDVTIHASAPYRV